MSGEESPRFPSWQFHAFGAYTGANYGDFDPGVGPVWAVCSQGWLGVHIFFAISGYCIAASIESGVRRGKPVLHFFRDRALRIYPTYWMALLFFVLVNLFSAPLAGLPLQSALPAPAPSFLSDIFLLQPFFKSDFFLLVSWSLAYEVCFYAICGAGMLLLLAGLPLAAVLGLGAGLALFGVFLHNPPFPLGLWPEFFLGVLSFVFLWARRSCGAAPALLVLLLAAVIVVAGVASKESFHLAMFLTAACSAAGIALLHPLDARISRVSWLKPIALVGVFSYSLYLVHLVVVSKLMNLSKRFVSTDSLWVLPVVLVAIIAAVAISAAFYRLIEAPLEHWRKHLSSAGRQCSGAL